MGHDRASVATRRLRLLSAAFLIAWLGTATTAVQAATEKYRLTWNDDPATTMSIGWNQLSGSNPEVCYGTDPDDSPNWTCQAPDRALEYRGMDNRFVNLTGLQADTAYYFEIRDSEGASDARWFRTAPDSPSDFTFIAGGDTRTNPEPRRWGQELVGKIRPLFIVLTGDFLDDGTAAEWDQWLDEWQLTQSEDGRMYPIVPVHGNHENADRAMVYNIFNTKRSESGDPDAYYGLSVAGNMIRLYTLNSELEPEVGYGEFSDQDATKWNEQADWFADDLAENAADHTWNIVTYHRPMRPHTSGKAEGLGRIAAWAQPMFDNGVDLAIECDTHMAKSTFPLEPTNTLSGNGDSVTGNENVGTGSFESFTRNDDEGIIFTGEGSWGAPTRPDDDEKPWTLDSESIWQYKLIQATPDEMRIRTVRFGDPESLEAGNPFNPETVTPLSRDEREADPLAIPEGLDLWTPLSGEVLTLPYGGTDTGTDSVELVQTGSDWRYLDDGSDPGTAWRANDFDDSAWNQGPAQLGYGDDDETTPIGFGGDPDDKHLTYYFRQTFEVADASQLIKLGAWLKRDDGAIVYINGQEALRSNMPSGPVDFQTSALSAIGGGAEDAWSHHRLLPGLLQDGTNTIAVEIHQANPGSSDISFDLNLTAVTAAPTGEVPAQATEVAGEAVSTSEIELSWTDNADNEVHYQVQRENEAGNWAIVGSELKPDTTRYRERGLDANTEYTYRVLAMNSAGLSEASDNATVTTQGEPVPVIFEEDFGAANLGTMNAINLGSNNNWRYEVRDGVDAAYMNGFGADEASEDWLITPAVELARYNNPTLTFDSRTKYDGGEIDILISTDYDGSGDPTAFTWTNLEAIPQTKDGQSAEWLPSEAWLAADPVDLSEFATDRAYIAFRYISTGTGGGDGPAWYVANVQITGERATLVDSDFNDDTLEVWNPVSIASNADWQASADTAEAEQAAYINGFGADAPSDDWLISPKLDLIRYSAPAMELDQWTKYGGGELAIKASTDYDGSGDPTAANWVDLNAVAHEKDEDGDWQPFDAWIRETTVDLSEFAGGDAYIAFHYISEGTGPGDGPKWAVDNIEITGKDKAEPVQSEDFASGGSGSWSTDSVASNENWAFTDSQRGNDPALDRPAMVMNGFGADEPSEDWLISPPIDLTEGVRAFVTFATYVAFGGGDLQLFVATDYDGDPTAASWDVLDFTQPADDSQTWTESGEVDLNAYLGETVHLGFKYTSTGTGGGDAAEWYVADIETHLATEGEALPLSASLASSTTRTYTERSVSFEGQGLNGAGEPYAFAWDFGDGETASGANVEHIYDRPGIYTVGLTVTDNATNTATAETTVEVRPATETPVPAPTGDLRIATYNVAMSEVGGAAADQLAEALSEPNLEKAQKNAEILQRVRPGVVLLNEFDYDSTGEAVQAFQDNYLSVAQADDVEPIEYPHVYLAPANTGTASGFDLNNDGEVVTEPGTDAYANDAFGYGRYPGQYAMVLLSQYPIVEDQVRTFQTFLWKDMPGALLPIVPETGEYYHSPEELEVFRLSSKTHWDVPVEVDGQVVHVLTSHPTPPVFDDGTRTLDGAFNAIDWNGLRNHDEIRFWADYVTPGRGEYIYDDNGSEGGLAPGKRFVMLGDQNADPNAGDTTGNPIALMLESPAVQGDFRPASEGGRMAAPDDPYGSFRTATFGLRVDYVLPSEAGLSIQNGAVFWPPASHPNRDLVSASDHRLVWMDVAVTAVTESATSLIDVTPVEPGEACSTGGQRIEIGQDGNADGALQEAEITRTQYVCNGAEGPQGAAGVDSMVRVTNEPAGANCEVGGKRIDTGQDMNQDGTLQDDEIAETEYVCSTTGGGNDPSDTDGGSSDDGSGSEDQAPGEAADGDGATVDRDDGDGGGAMGPGLIALALAVFGLRRMRKRQRS